MDLQFQSAQPFAGSTTDNGLNKTATEMNDGLGKSPFSSPILTLHFQTGPPLKLHRDFIPPSSRLSLLIPAPSSFDIDSYHISLHHITSDAAHVLMQYLYTGKYQVLETPRQPLGPQSAIAAFRTAIQVYVASRDLQIDGLVSLAKEEIHMLGERVDIFSIIDIVKNAYPSPTADDTWFPSFMKERLDAALAHPMLMLKTDIPVAISDGMSIVKFIIKGVLQAYGERLEDLARTKEEAAVMEAVLAEKETIAELMEAEREEMEAEREAMKAEREAMKAERETMTADRDGLLGRLDRVETENAQIVAEKAEMASKMQALTSCAVFHRSRTEEAKGSAQKAIGHSRITENPTAGGADGSEHLPSSPSLIALRYGSVKHFTPPSDSEPESPPKRKKDKKGKARRRRIRQRKQGTLLSLSLPREKFTTGGVHSVN
ncbi:hypothetical protein B0T25DRAFT_359743 [Lasiosphaeria hispida]|uniref:BTB domain-containing protein n=1 Tax=Lasiosphaeria hispida TaxID=260671 RepID=A0AAJ0H7R6_9PEZI|nr:hypothetical protein B0T25DRAFT_359743 [Lasiosphaeria hispida]